jgi:hypothetical protein
LGLWRDLFVGLTLGVIPTSVSSCRSSGPARRAKAREGDRVQDRAPSSLPLRGGAGWGSQGQSSSLR